MDVFHPHDLHPLVYPSKLLIMAPEIKHILDLDFTAQEPEPGTENVLYTTFGKIERGEDRFYYGQIFKREQDISFPEFTRTLKQIPDGDIYPALATHSDIRVAQVPDPFPDHIHLKRPSIQCYDDFKAQDKTSLISNHFLQEIYVLEALSEAPHPGIVKYYGCRVRRGWITGIALEHYWKDLKRYVQARKGPPIDEEPFLAALESAIRHLHTCGFAHNDVKPSNILLNEERMPILVDFNSCQPIGKELNNCRGSPGWSDPEDPWDTSEIWHDWFGVEKIREWLKEARESWPDQ